MLDIKFIRENPDIVKDAAEKKRVEIDIPELLKVDDERRAVMTELEKAKSEQNSASSKVVMADVETKANIIL